jgi:chromosome segregation ATPase
LGFRNVIEHSHSPVEGAPEQIDRLRQRYNQVAKSVGEYDKKVSRQAAELDRKNQNPALRESDGNEYEMEADPAPLAKETLAITEEELRAEGQEIRELEQKKRALEERVASMERDLGGLLQ